jgi:type II secretory pathway pseudopilin PulG
MLNKRGITLVETIVSAVILGITLGVLLNSFVSGRVAATMSRHHLQAMEIARQKMEELRELGYNKIYDDETGSVYTDFDPGPFTVTIDDGGTANEDFNFNDILDREVDDEGNPIDGTGEDLNNNGVLDKNLADDLSGTLTITGYNNPSHLCGCSDDLDHALQIKIEVSWIERIWFKDKQQTESVETYITKYGGL